MFSRSVSLTVQLTLTFVGLILTATIALTVAAYRSSIASLEADARKNVTLEAESREQTVTQLLTLRQQRAEGFLVSVESICGEPTTGRIGWSEDCVKTMTEEFRVTAGATGAELSYRGRRLRRSGQPVALDVPLPGALAKVIDRRDQPPVYLMRANLGDLLLVMEFDLGEIALFFTERSGLGARGEVFIATSNGSFLTPPRFSTSRTPPGAAVEPFSDCRLHANNIIDVDYRGVQTIHGYRPVRALGDVCVDAHSAYDEALAPAERLRDDLVRRGALFVALGAFVSVLAAQWIATPVRRLAAAARALQHGEFAEPVPLGGPAEIRELGRTLDAMRSDVASLVSREQAARQEAEVANRTKDEFLAAVSHELRTPLTAILGWIRLLRVGRLTPERTAHAMDAIERSAEAQRRLIEDLLDVSRIISKRLRLVRSATHLSEVVEAALDAVRPQATEKGIRLDYSIEDPDLIILADAQRLEQVVWNLAWNAVKFTPESGTVHVTLRRADDRAELIVSDTGMGISESFLPQVFEWFRQDSQKFSSGGLGLGLGIVRQIVQLHGGEIRAESAGAGQGSTFTVMLPLYHAAGAVQNLCPLPESDPLNAPLAAVKVLVVDDDLDTREVVRAVLEDAGASVHTASSASEARNEAVEWHPDVVVSDVRMPDEDGYALMRWLRQLDVQVPAIALTAYARRQDADEAYAAGFHVHMPKPADPGRLVDTVAVLASARRN